MEPLPQGISLPPRGYYGGLRSGERRMGVTWVCADVNYFAAFEPWPARAPRHRKPPRLVRAARLTAGLPRSLAARKRPLRPGGSSGPGKVPSAGTGRNRRKFTTAP